MQVLPEWRQSVFLVASVIVLHVIVWIIGYHTPSSHYFSGIDEDTWERRIDRIRRQGIQADMRSWHVEHRSREKDEKSMSSSSSPLFANSRYRMDLCVAVINEDGRSLEPMMGALLSRLPLLYEDRVRVSIFNTTTMRGDRRLADLVEQEELLYPRHWQPTRELIGASDNLRRMVEYDAVLKTLAGRNCRYGLILADNLLAAEGWADRVLRIIEDASTHPHPHPRRCHHRCGPVPCRALKHSPPS